MPRRKACLLLNHIYEETHPLVPGTPQPLQSSQDSEDSQDPPDQCVEERLGEESETEEDVACSQEEETLHSRLAQFVKQRPSLHQTAVLLREPLWLRELHGQVKQAGIKCGLNQLQVSLTRPYLR